MKSKRLCLSCGRSFLSQHVGNRICQPCRRKEWRGIKTAPGHQPRPRVPASAMIGRKFARLTVRSIAHRTVETARRCTLFNVECECGCAPEIIPSGENGRGLMIECLTEGCVNPHTSYYDHDSAIRTWNRRTRSQEKENG